MKKVVLGLSIALLAGAALSAPKPAPIQGTCQLIAMTNFTSFAGYGATSRSFSCSYQTSKTAPAGATATLASPEGLGWTSPTPLTIQNLQGETGSVNSEVIHYWNSAPTIPKGQPEVLKTQHDPKQKTTWKGGSAGNLDYMQIKYVKPGQMQLDETSKSPGAYRLKISYVGEIGWDLTEKQQFMEPLQATKPETPASVKTSDAIEVTWKNVPNVVGYTVYAAGKNAAGKTCYWENAYQAQTAWYTMGAAGALKAGKLVPPDVCRVQIPAAIFTGPVSLSITGYSPECKGTGPLSPWAWAQTMTTMQLGQ